MFAIVCIWFGIAVIGLMALTGLALNLDRFL